MYTGSNGGQNMKNHNYKLVISDLDGTLLNAQHTLSEYTKRAVQTLVDEGVHFMIATGRHHCDATKIMEKLGVETYLITANGATVANHAGELIEQATIPKAVVEGILDIETPKGVFKNLYQGELWLMEETDKIFDAYYSEGDFQYTLCRFKEHLHKPINKVFFTAFVHENLIHIAEEVKAKYGDSVDVTFSMPECLEIMPKGVNKGTAVLKTLEHFGVAPEDVIAFGDGMNDYEMLKVVGKGYVMSNANIQLKSHLPNHEHIGYNHEDAVAREIVRLFGLEEKVPYKAVV